MKNKYKVAYQGIPGAFSHIAICKYFKNKAEALSKKSFADVFKAVLAKKADFAIVPFKNTTTGNIKINHQLQKKYKLKIVGQVKLKISHNLLCFPTKKIAKTKRLKMIKKAYSHPQALKQCTGFFKKYNWIKPIKAEDTAGSAKFIANKKELNIAAIASLKAAKLYHLQVLYKNIENCKRNFTYFWILIATTCEVVFP